MRILIRKDIRMDLDSIDGQPTTRRLKKQDII